jgi:hypothetical protein
MPTDAPSPIKPLTSIRGIAALWVLFLLFALGGLVGSCRAETVSLPAKSWDQLTPQEQQEIFSAMDDTMSDLGGFMWNMRRNMNLKTYDEFWDYVTKLDFSLPGDPDYNKDADLAAYRIGMLHATKPQIPPNFSSQEDLDKWAGTKNTRMIFNVRRHVFDTGAIIGNLYAIVPLSPPFSTHCTDHVVNVEFRIAPDNHEIVDDPKGFTWTKDEAASGTACLKLNDGHVYYFVSLYHHKLN